MCDPYIITGSSPFLSLLWTVCRHGQCSSYFLFFSIIVGCIFVYMCACVTLMICVYKRRWSIWKTCLVMAAFEETTWNTEMMTFFYVVSHRLSDRLNTWPGQEGNTPEDKGTWFYSSIFLMSFLFYYYFPRILISEDFNIWRIFETQAKKSCSKTEQRTTFLLLWIHEKIDVSLPDLLLQFLWHYCKKQQHYLGYISMSFMLISSDFVWLVSFSSLIANSMHPAMDTWGSCPTSVVRSTGAGCVRGPKMTPANQSTSLPSWDTRLAWPTRWGRCTAPASVCMTGLTATWMHERIEGKKDPLWVTPAVCLGG